MATERERLTVIPAMPEQPRSVPGYRDMILEVMTQVLWEFVRGDLAPNEFERWVYATPSLENELGPELYRATISANYARAEDVWRIRCSIGAHVRERSPDECMCIRLRHLDVVDMGTFRA